MKKIDILDLTILLLGLYIIISVIEYISFVLK